MPAYQTTYAQTIAPAVLGLVADSQTATIISRLVEPAAGVGFGQVVVQGVADGGIALPTGGGLYKGVTVLSATIAPTVIAAASPNVYPQGATAAVMTTGTVWVSASVAVAPGQPAYFTPTTGALTNVSAGNTPIPEATFDSTAAAGGLVRLRLA